MRKSRWGCAVGVVVLLALVGLAGWRSLPEDAMGSDEEYERIVASLRPEPLPPIADKDNWDLLITDWSPPREANAEILASEPGRRAWALAQAVRARPAWQGSASALFPSGRNLLVHLARRAEFLESQGRDRDALDSLDVALHMERTMSARGGLIDYLAARVALKKTREVMAQLLRKDAVSLPRAKKIALEGLSEHRETLIRASLVSFARDLEPVLRDPRRGPPSEEAFWDLDRADEFDALHFGKIDRIDTARRIAELFERRAKALRAPGAFVPVPTPKLPWSTAASTLPEGSWPRRWEAFQNRLQIRRTPNAMGLEFVTYDILPEEGVYHRYERTDRAIQVLAAISVYRRERGSLPPALARLVGVGLLRSIPTDPESGTPIAYDRTSATVYFPSASGASWPVR